MREPNKDWQSLLVTQAPAEMERMGFIWLIAAALTTAFLWQIPLGNYILYPFTILATWFHEMSHGLMALLLGGDFRQLLIFPNGSGVAFYSYSRGFLFSGFGRALIAAAGPMGPPIAGAVLILASRNLTTAVWCLRILGAFLLLSAVIWVRSLFGLIAISLLGLLVLGIALKAPRYLVGFTTQFLGVQACVSTYHQLNYLFSYGAPFSGLSDTAQIQQELFLPYWFWGTLMALASMLVLVQSLRIAYSSQ